MKIRRQWSQAVHTARGNVAPDGVDFLMPLSCDSPRRVAVVITSRASYARIRSVLTAITQHDDLELQLVLGASLLLERYGMAANIIEADGFSPDARVYMVLEGERPITMAKTTGLGIIELATVLSNLQPDIVLTVADRFETLATAVAASYMNLPVAHVQGGELTGSIDDKVRHAVTKLSDLHFVASETAARRVVQMGEPRASVHVTGCPSIDLAALVRAGGRHPREFASSYSGVGPDLDFDQPYLVALQHPVTTEYERSLLQVGDTLDAVERLDMQTLWFWPNPDAGSDLLSKGLRVFREQGRGRRIHFLKNAPPEEFLSLVANAKCVVGNSSVGIRECAYLGVPVVNVGERQRGRDRGLNVVDVEHDAAQIADAVRRQAEHGPYASSDIYGDGQAGIRIAEVLAKDRCQVGAEFVDLPFTEVNWGDG